MKILYVHGIGSAGGGNTVKLFKKYFSEYQIDSPDIPENPKEALKFLREICNNYDFVVGTSLGGFYTMQLFGPIKILINPAIDAYNVVTKIGFGTHYYLREREDNKTTYEINDNFVNELKELYNNFFDDCFDEESMLETYAIFGSKDIICNCQELFRKKYYKNNMVVADFGHRMTEEVFKETFVNMFYRIIDEMKLRS